MEKNMRKNRIFYVDFGVKSTVYNAFCHNLKTAKTLAPSTFFEFFTKFSTPCGKLFPYVRNVIADFLRKKKIRKALRA